MSAIPQKLIYAVCHVASQMAFRWLPPPAHADLAGPAEQEAEDGDLSLEMEDWRGVIWNEETRVSLPWLVEYLARLDPDARRLATALWEHFSDLRRAGAHFVTQRDPHYPPGLRVLKDAPTGLSCVGDLNLLRRPAVAVIGSRMASALAVRESFLLGRALAEAGWLVVSGGALGCDIAAHHGVLAAAGQRCLGACVFAGGLGDLYPRANAMVFRRLSERRALFVSERLWRAPSRPFDFPIRNRIIGGWCQAVMLMQAAQRSGALVTARLALDAGRDVLVLLHPPGDVRAQGGATLLSEGAPGFSSARELMTWLGDPPSRVEANPTEMARTSLKTGFEPATGA